jgi:hypothetical protein
MLDALGQTLINLLILTYVTLPICFIWHSMGKRNSLGHLVPIFLTPAPYAPVKVYPAIYKGYRRLECGLR